MPIILCISLFVIIHQCCLQIEMIETNADNTNTEFEDTSVSCGEESNDTSIVSDSGKQEGHAIVAVHQGFGGSASRKECGDGCDAWCVLYGGEGGV
jgi:hypothetical protein